MPVHFEHLPIGLESKRSFKPWDYRARSRVHSVSLHCPRLLELDNNFQKLTLLLFLHRGQSLVPMENNLYRWRISNHSSYYICTMYKEEKVLFLVSGVERGKPKRVQIWRIFSFDRVWRSGSLRVYWRR